MQTKLLYGILTRHIKTISLVSKEAGYVAEINLSNTMKSSYSETLKFIQQMDGAYSDSYWNG